MPAGATHWRSARLRVGRATGSDLVIEDGSVSRSHAELRFEDGAWLVEDLRSANGVQVDGKPVQTARLTPAVASPSATCSSSSSSPFRRSM